MLSNVFAVVMNNTFERSNGTSKYLSRKVLFCSGSNTSNSALAGSPLMSADVLSISSSKNTGSLAPALFIP